MHWAHESAVKRTLKIQPRYVIAATVLVTLLMVTSAIVELVQSRRNLSHLCNKYVEKNEIFVFSHGALGFDGYTELGATASS
jgi:hypothetical protein